MNGFDIFYEDAQDKAGNSKYFNDPRVVKLVELAQVKHLPYIAEVIFKFKSKNYFLEYFDEFESNQYEIDFDEEIFDYHDLLTSIYKNRNHGVLGKLRGATLERLVYYHKQPKYAGSSAWIEPYVLIKSQTVTAERSIDVAGWNQISKRGECAECAVSAIYVTTATKKDEIRNLQYTINNVSDKITIYFVSFTLTSVLEQTVGLFSNINLIGRDKLSTFFSI